jgi:hypothetical protein
MPVDVNVTLRKVLVALQAEKSRIDRQITSIESVLNSANSLRRGKSRTNASARSTNVRRRRRMSAAGRRATSLRMKAYWAKRREAAAKRSAKKRK